jgi:hypothetical protein
VIGERADFSEVTTRFLRSLDLTREAADQLQAALDELACEAARDGYFDRAMLEKSRWAAAAIRDSLEEIARRFARPPTGGS